MNVPSEKKFFYPVIYCVDPYEKNGINHALSNVRTAKDNDADGVFLIGQGLSHIALAYIYLEIRRRVADFWIGLNFLDINEKEEPKKLEAIFLSLTKPNGLWVNGLPSKHFHLPFCSSLFGGVAFKHENPDPDKEDLIKCCEQAAQFVDIATTSGNKIGEPPSLNKLKTIYNYLDKAIPLAVAGGINGNNAQEMLPFVTHFLVSESITDISPCGKYLNGERVKRLADIIHSYS